MTQNGTTYKVLLTLVAIVVICGSIIGGAFALDSRFDAKVEKGNKHLLEVLTPQLDGIRKEISDLKAEIQVGNPKVAENEHGRSSAPQGP